MAAWSRFSMANSASTIWGGSPSSGEGRRGGAWAGRVEDSWGPRRALPKGPGGGKRPPEWLGPRRNMRRTLGISDVVGDPLDVIASGPTVPDTSTASQALEILRKFAAQPPEVPQAVFDVLERAGRDTTQAAVKSQAVASVVETRVVENHVI